MKGNTIYINEPRRTGTLKFLQGRNMDDMPMLKKSRIYEEPCQSNCDSVYYGKTIRNIKKIFNEHMEQFIMGIRRITVFNRHISFRSERQQKNRNYRSYSHPKKRTQEFDEQRYGECTIFFY